MTTIEAKLTEFATFPDGWNFGEGIVFLPETLEAVRTLCAFGLNLGYEAEVFPGSSGEIQIAFYSGEDEEIEIVVASDGDYEVLHCRSHKYITNVFDWTREQVEEYLLHLPPWPPVSPS